MLLKYGEFFLKPNIEKSFNEKISRVSSKGIDKKSVEHFKKNIPFEIEIIERKLRLGTYKFSPYLELLRVKRRDTNPRMLSLPTIRDRIVLNILKEILHSDFPDCVNKSLPNSYIRRIKKYLQANNKYKMYFLKTDIKQFYDEIDRDILMNQLSANISDKNILGLLKDAITTPTVPSNYRKEDREKYFSKKGIPQGLSISNVLAQIYLKSFDDHFKTKFKKSFYLRYVDDIIIISKSDCLVFKRSLESQLNKIKLTLNENKTKYGNLSDGTDFLGYAIKKASISINNKTLESQINKIAAKLTWFKKGIDDPKKRPKLFLNNTKGYKRKFLREVNEIITGSKSAKKNYGWLFYYIEVEDMTVFYRIDSIIESMFKKLSAFNYKRPKRLKRTVRAFYEIKFNNGGNYVNDYDKLNTINKKRRLLDEVAETDPENKYPDEEIDDLYDSYRNRNLENLERDISYGF